MRSVLRRLKLIMGTGVGRYYLITQKQGSLSVVIHMVCIILINAAETVCCSPDLSCNSIPDVPVPDLRLCPGPGSINRQCRSRCQNRPCADDQKQTFASSF